MFPAILFPGDEKKELLNLQPGGERTNSSFPTVEFYTAATNERSRQKGAKAHLMFHKFPKDIECDNVSINL